MRDEGQTAENLDSPESLEEGTIGLLVITVKHSLNPLTLW